ncbi:hypothetical protein LINGRAHAP2_LOCUS22639 [Linum grandiflorum]
MMDIGMSQTQMCQLYQPMSGSYISYQTLTGHRIQSSYERWKIWVYLSSGGGCEPLTMTVDMRLTRSMKLSQDNIIKNRK